MKSAGLGDRDLHFHDLRGTAATNFYLAGYEVREIAEIMAWSETRIEKIPYRYVNREAVLQPRIRRWEEAEAITKTAKP